MGSTWSRWLESGACVFDKKRFVNAKTQHAFYASLKLAVAVIERAVVEERAELEEASATNEDDQALAQLQYVLENWAREAGGLYDRVGDFPLILPIPTELHAPATGPPVSERKAPQEEPPKSQAELLLKAASCDRAATTEKLFEALERLTQKLPEDEFLRAVAKYPRAVRLFISVEMQVRADAETPFRLLASTGQYTKAASHVGKLAYGEESYVKKLDRLQEMAALYERAQDAPTASAKDRATASFNRVMTEEMIELIDAQNRLENRLGVMHLVGSSVVETVHKLLAMFPTIPTALSTAASFAEDFHIHPRQFWYALVKVLPMGDQWRTLFVLGAAVPPPFGYEPVAEALVQAQRTDLARELLASIASSEARQEVISFLGVQASNREDEPGDYDGDAHDQGEDATVQV